MLAMPTASDGAPPVRANSVLSPISLASVCICSTVTGKPQPEIVATAASRRAADHAGGAVDGEVHARIEQRRGDHRHDGDEGFHRHAAVADQADVALVADAASAWCRSTTSAWKPEIAPQAMVMNTNGKILPREDRTGAVDELRQRRHLDLGMHR